MQTVLVVDDEPKIAQLARDYLEHAGFAVLIAGDGPSALHAARVRQPDLVVLALGLRGLDGLEVLRTIRAAAPTPIVVVTARDTELDKLLGLGPGAGDSREKTVSPPQPVAGGASRGAGAEGGPRPRGRRGGPTTSPGRRRTSLASGPAQPAGGHSV